MKKYFAVISSGTKKLYFDTKEINDIYTSEDVIADANKKGLLKEEEMASVINVKQISPEEYFRFNKSVRVDMHSKINESIKTQKLYNQDVEEYTEKMDEDIKLSPAQKTYQKAQQDMYKVKMTGWTNKQQQDAHRAKIRGSRSDEDYAISEKQKLEKKYLSDVTKNYADLNDDLNSNYTAEQRWMIYNKFIMSSKYSGKVEIHPEDHQQDRYFVTSQDPSKPLNQSAVTDEPVDMTETKKKKLNEDGTIPTPGVPGQTQSPGQTMVKTSAQNQLEQKIYGQINPTLKNTAQGIIKTLGAIPKPQQTDIDKVVASNKLDLSNPDHKKMMDVIAGALVPTGATTAMGAMNASAIDSEDKTNVSEKERDEDSWTKKDESFISGDKFTMDGKDYVVEEVFAEGILATLKNGSGPAHSIPVHKIRNKIKSGNLLKVKAPLAKKYSHIKESKYSPMMQMIGKNPKGVIAILENQGELKSFCEYMETLSESDVGLLMGDITKYYYFKTLVAQKVGMIKEMNKDDKAMDEILLDKQEEISKKRG